MSKPVSTFSLSFEPMAYDPIYEADEKSNHANQASIPEMMHQAEKSLQVSPSEKVPDLSEEFDQLYTDALQQDYTNEFDVTENEEAPTSGKKYRRRVVGTSTSNTPASAGANGNAPATTVGLQLSGTSDEIMESLDNFRKRTEMERKKAVADCDEAIPLQCTTKVPIKVRFSMKGMRLPKGRALLSIPIEADCDHKHLYKDLPKDVLISQDLSGSMSGNGIIQSRKAIKEVAGTLRFGVDRLNVVGYGDELAVTKRSLKYSNANIEEEMNKMEADLGGTEALLGVKLAVDIANELPEPKGVQRMTAIILTTDGINKTALTREVCHEFQTLIMNQCGPKGRTITASAIGIGLDARAEHSKNLQNFADVFGGKRILAASENLGDAMKDVLNNVNPPIFKMTSGNISIIGAKPCAIWDDTRNRGIFLSQPDGSMKIVGVKTDACYTGKPRTILIEVDEISDTIEVEFTGEGCNLISGRPVPLNYKLSLKKEEISNNIVPSVALPAEFSQYLAAKDELTAAGEKFFALFPDRMHWQQYLTKELLTFLKNMPQAKDLMQTLGALINFTKEKKFANFIYKNEKFVTLLQKARIQIEALLDHKDFVSKKQALEGLSKFLHEYQNNIPQLQEHLIKMRKIVYKEVGKISVDNLPLAASLCAAEDTQNIDAFRRMFLKSYHPSDRNDFVLRTVNTLKNSIFFMGPRALAEAYLQFPTERFCKLSPHTPMGRMVHFNKWVKGRVPFSLLCKMDDYSKDHVFRLSVKGGPDAFACSFPYTECDDIVTEKDGSITYVKPRKQVNHELLRQNATDIEIVNALTMFTQGQRFPNINAFLEAMHALQKNPIKKVVQIKKTDEADE